MSEVDAPAEAQQEAGGAGEEAPPPVLLKSEGPVWVRRGSLVAWICLLIVYLVWGSTYLAIRVGVETMPPLLMAAARNLLAGLIMFSLAARGRRKAMSAPLASAALSRRRLPSSLPRRSSVQPSPRRLGSREARTAPEGATRAGRWPNRAEWLGCAIVGVLLLVANGAVGIGEQTVPSGLAALLVATVPLWLLGIDAALNHARLGLAQLGGLALGLAGVGLLSGLGGRSGGISAVGVIVILAAAAAWALGTIMARRVTLPSSPALASGMQLLCGGVTLLAIGAAAGEFGDLRLAQISGRSWLALGYLIVAGSIVAFSAYGIAIRTLPTATVATYAYVNPVIAVLLGTLILNERLTPVILAGGALIVGAVVLVIRRTPPAH